MICRSLSWTKSFYQSTAKAGFGLAFPIEVSAANTPSGPSTLPLILLGAIVTLIAAAVIAAGRIWLTSRRTPAIPPALELAARQPFAPADAVSNDAAPRPGSDLATRYESALTLTAPQRPTPYDPLDIIRRLSRDVYWEQDLNGVITRVDDGPVISPLKFRIGRCRWDDGALPIDPPSWTNHRERIAKHEPFSDLTWIWSDPNGRVRVAIDSGVPRFNTEGVFIGYAGISRDANAEVVTDRSRRLATAALLAASEPVLWIEAGATEDVNWRVIWANSAACRLLDRSERELRDLPCATLFGPSSPSAAAVLNNALRARHEARLHADMARRYGDARSVEIRLEPLPGSNALRPCAALLLHDRSADQARLQEDSRSIERLRARMRERSLELETTAKELESFTYTVSHDLRAPIRVVEGFARILQEDYAERFDRLGHEHLQRILSAASRMTRMIDGLMGLTTKREIPAKSASATTSGRLSAVTMMMGVLASSSNDAKL